MLLSLRDSLILTQYTAKTKQLKKINCTELIIRRKNAEEREKERKEKLYSIKIDNRFKLKTVLCEKRIMFVNILRDVEKRNEGKQRISQIFNRKPNYFHNYFVFTNKLEFVCKLCLLNFSCVLVETENGCQEMQEQQKQQEQRVNFPLLFL